MNGTVVVSNSATPTDGSSTPHAEDTAYVNGASGTIHSLSDLSALQATTMCVQRDDDPSTRLQG